MDCHCKQDAPLYTQSNVTCDTGALDSIHSLAKKASHLQLPSKGLTKVGFLSMHH